MTVDETLSDIWERALNGGDASRDSFFDAGGDAVGAADLLALVRDAFDVDVPMATFVAAPTRAGLSNAVGLLVLRQDTLQSAVAPLAFSQEGMLWHELLAPGSFNLPPLVRRYHGVLDVAALGDSLGDLIERHAPLRTTFHIVGGRPLQYIGAKRPPRTEVIDLTHLDRDGQQAEIARVVADATRRPFDLEAGPLFVPVLYRLADDDHVLVIRLHHLVFDDWAVDVFRRDLSALYSARAAGARAQLPQLRVDFPTFCRRQRRALAATAGNRELTYWRQELAGAPLTLRLPIEDPRLPAGSPHPAAGALSHLMPAGSVEQLRVLARRQRTTLFMALLAVFAVVVHDYTGRDDLLMASVVANRNSTDLERLIGCFTKKILLRLRLSGDPTFLDMLDRSRTALLGALANQDLPFETVLQQALGPAAVSHGLVPDISVVFQAETPRRERLHLPGITMSGFDTGTTTQQPHFAAGESEGTDESPPVWGAGLYQRTFLILSILEAGDDVSLIARGVFHPPAVQELLGRFETVLGAVISRPDARLTSLVAPPAGRDSGGPAGRHSGPVVDFYGFPIEPGRIEDVVSRCPGVREAAVIVSEDALNGERLVAYVVADDAGSGPTLASLRTHLWSEIPGYAWPAAMVMVDAIPRSADGGIDRRALPTPPPVHRKAEPPAGANPAERILADLWSEVLGGGEVSVDANYWQKFSFVGVVRRARELGVDVDTACVKRNRVIRTLSVDISAIGVAR